MKKIILIGIIIFSLTGCFKRTVHPDSITKNIMNKYNIPYVIGEEKAVKWLENEVLDNFFIHIEIDKKGKYEQIKKDILDAKDNKYIKLFSENDLAILDRDNPFKYHSYGATTIGNKAYCSAEMQNNSSHYRSYKECMEKLQKWNRNMEKASKYKNTIDKILSIDTLNTENVSYSVINRKHFYGYSSFGTIVWGTLVLKYGFIEPNNSNKAYFYTSYSMNNSSLDLFHIKRMTEKSLIYKTITLLDSNHIPYKYISDEYSKDKL